MKKGRDKDWRCTICGKFLPYDHRKIITHFTPDSEYTSEKLEINHKKCETKEKK